jgi:hypothetical protein
MPILPSGTAPTIPTKEPSEASATAQRASRMPRKSSKALGSADQRTTDRSSRIRPRSTSSICRMRTPDSARPSARGKRRSPSLDAILFCSTASLFVKASKVSPDKVSGVDRVLRDKRGTRMPRVRP